MTSPLHNHSIHFLQRTHKLREILGSCFETSVSHRRLFRSCVSLGKWLPDASKDSSASIFRAKQSKQNSCSSWTARASKTKQNRALKTSGKHSPNDSHIPEDLKPQQHPCDNLTLQRVSLLISTMKLEG